MLRSPSRRLLSVLRPVSRRSRRGSPGTVFDFDAEVERLFALLHTALEPLVPLNPGFALLTDSEGRLNLDMGAKGAYVFSKDVATQTVRVQSPVSGVFGYVFDRESGLWLSQTDGHDLRGLITRDVLRHCVGCPKF